MYSFGSTNQEDILPVHFGKDKITALNGEVLPLNFGKDTVIAQIRTYFIFTVMQSERYSTNKKTLCSLAKIKSHQNASRQGAWY